MSFFEDEEDLHDEGLCDPRFCRFCEMEQEGEKAGSPDALEGEEGTA